MIRSTFRLGVAYPVFSMQICPKKLETKPLPENTFYWRIDRIGELNLRLFYLLKVQDNVYGCSVSF